MKIQISAALLRQYAIVLSANFVGGYLIDFIGRKYCILAVSIPKLLTAILLICATELWMVILGRSVMFMADCFVLVVVPIYAAEIASKDQRGALGTLLQVFSSLGIVISLAIGPNVSYHVLSYILLGLIILVTVPVIFIPESPYYLHSDGKTGDSLKILTLLRESDTQAKQELADYELTIDKTFDKMACFKDKIFVKALLITLLLFGGTQFVGFNSVSVYLQTILISTNTNVMPEVASAIIGAIQVVSSLFVTFIMSTFGRKTILLVSLAGMCAGMITGFMNYLPIISLILVVVCYSAGIGAIVWPATTELFEGQARAFGVSIGLTFCQIAMFFITKYFSTMTNALGPASTYWFYGTNCVIIAVVIAIFLPETKGKTFAEIQKALANLIGGHALDIFGRKLSILALSIPRLLASVLLIFATEVWMVLVGRTVMMMSDSFVLVVIPIYAAEIASKNHRGALGTLLQVFSSLGIVISLAIGPNVSYSVMSYILCGFVILAILPVIFIPESPYHVYSKGRTEDALKILTLIRESEMQAKEELADYKLTIDDNFDKIAIFKDKIFVKALLLTLLIFGGAQLIGFNAVSFYLQTILISTKTDIMPEVASAIIGVIQFISSLFVTTITSLFGRKSILLVSIAGMFAGMIGLGVFFQISSPDVHVSGFMNYLPIISLILVVICYSAGIGAIMWPITTELFEGQTRAYGVSIGLFFCQVVMFLTTKYFSSMTAALGPASTYWLFSTNCVICAVLIGLFLPETKGKSFSEIQQALGKMEAIENVAC
ncbi:unnamed protein product [Leptidea sinapis]|uniref:Major facilitator superfamily (MFS) profile domain-containing protein n=1 Tax=Leptidea sinapis TaxID=189913 RepID=A0A5E4QBG7_9NEOP|nr:unnamed protein product [Leptidea sinapis]